MLAAGASNRVKLRVKTGKRRLAAGEALTFRFELLLTPCKPLALNRHWEMGRYIQVGYPNKATAPWDLWGVHIA